MTRPKAIFFDVNGTLLDTSAMQEPIGKALNGRNDLYDLWMTTLLHSSLVESAIRTYHRFDQIAAAALQIVAARNGIQISASAAADAVAPMRTLSPFPDVEDGLSKLRDSGYRLIAFTNSARDACHAQLQHAGLAQYFDRQLSVEDIRLYKPHLQAYRWAAQQANVPIAEAMMVAAHGWDVSGAKAAGMQTALVSRAGQALYPLAPLPDYSVNDLNELAAALS